jgi:hypothetical protein
MRQDKSLFHEIDTQTDSTIRASINLIIRSRSVIASTETLVSLTRERLAESGKRLAASNRKSERQ